MKHFILAIAVGAAVAGGGMCAPRASAQSIPTTRSLGKVVAIGPTLRTVTEVRPLSDGRVLVNDAGAHQVVLFDSMLTHPVVVLDSTGVPNRRYGRSGSLIPFLGDSTLFVDWDGKAFLVLDPAGAIARVMALPTGKLPTAKSRLDAKGRLVFDARQGRASPNVLPGGARGPTTTTIDYWTVFAHDFTTRALDTVFQFKPDTIFRAPTPALGGAAADAAAAAVATMVVQPPPPALFPVRNDWALMSDGTLAVVHGQDYHIDWVDADGKITPSAKIPHEWKQLSDDDKVRMADSMTAERDSANRVELATHAGAAAQNGQATYDEMGRIQGWLPLAPSRGGGTPAAVTPRPPPPQALVRVSPRSIPEYLPPFMAGVLADRDNHLWIPLSMTMVPPPDRVYDIVDRSAKLIDRIRVTSASIVGFGAGGNVYLFVRDGDSGRLERVRYR